MAEWAVRFRCIDGWLVLALLAATLGIGPYLLAKLERPPIEYRNEPFPVLRDPVRPGDELVLLVDRCIYDDEPVPYAMTRQLTQVDGAPENHSIVLTSTGVLAPPGCELLESRVNVLPSDIPPGRYYLEAISSVRGSWQTFNVRWRTAVFTVVPRDG